jgi:hypothetical protein
MDDVCCTAYVCLWHKADISTVLNDVCFRGQSGRGVDVARTWRGRDAVRVFGPEIISLLSDVLYTAWKKPRASGSACRG